MLRAAGCLGPARACGAPPLLAEQPPQLPLSLCALGTLREGGAFAQRLGRARCECGWASGLGSAGAPAPLTRPPLPSPALADLPSDTAQGRMPRPLRMRQAEEDVCGAAGASLTASNGMAGRQAAGKRPRGSDAADAQQQQQQQKPTGMHLRSAQKRLLAAAEAAAARADSGVDSSQQLDRTDSCGGPRGSADAHTTAAAAPTTGAPAEAPAVTQQQPPPVQASRLAAQAEASAQQAAPTRAMAAPTRALAAPRIEQPAPKRRRLSRAGVPAPLPSYELRTFDRPSPPFRHALPAVCLFGAAGRVGGTLPARSAAAAAAAGLPAKPQHTRRSASSPHTPEGCLAGMTTRSVATSMHKPATSPHISLPGALWCRDDDENGHYQFEIGENLAPRFKIMRKFGEGTFGQVRQQEGRKKDRPWVWVEQMAGCRPEHWDCSARWSCSASCLHSGV